MSLVRDRSSRIRSKSWRRPISSLAVLAFLLLPLGAPNAAATNSEPTLGLYLDQPFVQGSYVAEDFPSESSVTTFNDQNYGNVCTFEGAVLESLFSGSPDCHIQTEINYGGASTTSSTPVVGQFPEPVKYGQVGSGGASIVFNTPQTYFGLWWSAGSVGNEIQLLSGTNILASTSANDVASSLSSNGSISSQVGDQYATRLYIRNPVDWYTVGTPNNFSDQDMDNSYQTNNTMAAEPFVYIHFVAAPGVTFDRVNLIAPGNGFEFDNFTTSSSLSVSAPSRLVLQRQLYEPTYVDFDANGGSGALPRQYSIDNAAAYLQSGCLDYEDPTRCISALNNSYSTQFLGWNTARDGSGDAYYFENWMQYPFTESTTMYAQWRNSFSFYNTTNPDADVSNIWDYVDYDTQTSSSVSNFADITLPAPERSGQYLEGWYTYAPDWSSLIRVGGPGEVVSASVYSTWDSNIFGRWLDNPPASLDIDTPETLFVYPLATSVELPNLPIVGDTVASICLVESDSSGNEISSSLQFTDLGTSSTGFSSSYLISSSTALITSQSRYLRVTVAASSVNNCQNGTSHTIEVRPLEASLTAVIPLNLTER